MSLLAEFRALDRRIWILAAARLVVTAGFSAVMPFLAIHLAIERGVAAIKIGLIWTIAGSCGAAMQWVAGELADRFGRRPLLLGALMLRAVNLVLLGRAIGAGDSLTSIGALCVVNAVLRAFFDPVATAAVADLSSADERVSAFALQRVGINIGWAAGPTAAALAAGVSYSLLFYWSAPLTLVAAAAVATIPETLKPGTAPPRGPQDWLAFRGDRAFVRFLWSTLALYLMQTQLYHTLSIYAARHLHLSRAEVGTLYTLNGALVALLQLPAVVYIRRLGTHGALFVGSIGYAVSYAACGLAIGHGTLLVCVVAITLSEIISSPAQQTASAAMAPAGRVGAYAGLTGLAQVIGQSAGPLIGTTVLDATPDRLSWFLLALFGVAAAVGYRRGGARVDVSSAPAR